MANAAVFVIGAGPGIGRSVACRFAAKGHPVGVLARSRSTVDSLLADLPPGAAGTTADVADEPGLRSALLDLVGRLGAPELVVYNAGVIRADTVAELDAGTLRDTFAVNVGGALTTAATLLPLMTTNGGSYLMTSGMPDPLPALTSLSLGKAGLRALAELLDRDHRPHGVRCTTITICGPVARGTAYDPDAIAAEYEYLHRLAPQDRPVDVRFGDPADAAG